MTAKEKRAHEHLIAARPLTEPEQRLCDGIVWEEARGNTVPEEVRSLLRQREARLSKDPEVLRLASGGLEAFFERTARRILSEDRDSLADELRRRIDRLRDQPEYGALRVRHVAPFNAVTP